MPSSTDVACVTAPGTYTVDVAGGYDVGGLVVGATSGAPTVDVDGSGGGSSLSLGSAGGWVTANGNLVFTDSATLFGPGVLTVDSGGVVSTAGASGTVQLESSISTEAGGTVSIGGTDSRAPLAGGTITNDGTWQVASGAQMWLRLDGSTFTSEPGSTLTVSGTMLVDDGGGSPATFVQSGGTESGSPVVLRGGVTLVDSAGTGAFNDIGSDTVSGTIPSGQTVTVDASGAGDDLALSGVVTDDGDLVVSDSPSYTAILVGPGTLSVGSGGVLSTTGNTTAGPIADFQTSITNEVGGTVSIGAADSRADGLNMTITNYGTWVVASGTRMWLRLNGGTFTSEPGSTMTVSGTLWVDDGGGNPATFVQSGGTESGSPVVLKGGVTLVDSAGTGAFDDIGNDTVSGTIPSGQTVTVDSSGGGDDLALSGVVTDDGSLVLSSTSGPTLLVGPGSLTVGSGGMLSTTGSANEAGFQTSIANEAGGTVTIGATDSRENGTTFTNSGTLQVTDSNELTLYGGSTLTNTSTGTIGVVVDATTSSAWGIAGAGVTLDGTLAVTTVGTPTVGATFTPITGPVTGTFAAFSFGPWDYTVTYPSGSVLLTLVAGAANKLVFTTQPTPGQNIAATGTGSFSASVAIQDGGGNTVTTDNTTTANLAIGINPAAGVLSCTNTGGLTVTAVAGVANFTGCAITKAGTG
ncbi:MAG: beta strand repeat-containing protein, partial [Acidimicrobiales bacterium]